ncbi:MAG TPA: Uma2 family endonuclease [Pyrinomonadaceae bacterium]|nr:Uma2 family endonuclease [Pyrinomonadaceae bacterium]
METSVYLGHPPLIVHLQPVVELSDDQLYEFAQLNRDLRIERNAQGELIIMPPTGGETGQRNAEITMQLRLWAKSDGSGATFDSSTGFRLPNGAVRSPDASWIKHSSLAGLGDEEKKKFIPLCPDFIIELRSATDSLSMLQEKMREYLDNGARLGLLLDPEQKRVYVYRPTEEVAELENPATVSGEPILSGFVLDLREIW